MRCWRVATLSSSLPSKDFDGEGSRYGQRLLERKRKLYASSFRTNPAEQIDCMYFRNSADEPSANQPTIIEGLENDEDHVQDIDKG
jgi:hypothetical protein